MFSSFSSHRLKISPPPLNTDILEHVPGGPYLLKKFCEGLQQSKVAPATKIVSCTHYKGACLHRSLILHGQKDHMPHFYLCLDHHLDCLLMELLVHSGTALAKDTVCIYCLSVQRMINIWPQQPFIPESLNYIVEPPLTEE